MGVAEQVVDHAGRFAKVRASMDRAGIDALLLSHGGDLPWLTGYRAMATERLTLLVLTQQEATLLVPRVEEAKVTRRDEFEVRGWSENEDPLALAAKIVGKPKRAGISSQAWAETLLGLQRELGEVAFVPASTVTGPLRAVKDAGEIAALRAAAQAADVVAGRLQSGSIPVLGRREASVARDIAEALVEAGHRAAKFVIVASGANAASPHHEAGDRIIGGNECVVCDFGGELGEPESGWGYCSDITRTLFTGEPSGEVSEAYAALKKAQDAALAAAKPGVAAGDVDAAAREVLEGYGYAEWFIHRTGHGIGVEIHEEPWILAGSSVPLEVGNVFSIEPGIYLPRRWGMRLEDIVMLGESGAERLNETNRDLVSVGGR